MFGIQLPSDARPTGTRPLPLVRIQTTKINTVDPSHKLMAEIVVRAAAELSVDTLVAIQIVNRSILPAQANHSHRRRATMAPTRRTTGVVSPTVTSGRNQVHTDHLQSRSCRASPVGRGGTEGH